MGVEKPHIRNKGSCSIRIISPWICELVEDAVYLHQKYVFAV